VGQNADDRERHADGQHADDQGQRGRDQRSERQDQDDQGERQEPLLTFGAVLGYHGADVEVQRRTPGHQCPVSGSIRHPGHGGLHQFSNRHDQGAGTVATADVQRDDHEGRSPVAAEKGAVAGGGVGDQAPDVGLAV
jgi:hypothetical protein